MSGAFAGCSQIIEQNMIKIAAFRHTIQKDGGDPTLPHVFERGRVVPARYYDQRVDFAPNQRANPLLLPGGVFLTVCEYELVVGKGSALFEAADNCWKKAPRNVGHHNA